MAVHTIKLNIIFIVIKTASSTNCNQTNFHSKTTGSLERPTTGTEGTLLRRLLSLATRPSPLAASHSPKDLAAAALTIVQQLAAHIAGSLKVLLLNITGR